MQAMLDLETLGTRPGCIVLSIGCVTFDAAGIKESYHAHIDFDKSEALGLKAEARTAMWWLEQSKDAQNAILKGNAMEPIAALIGLSRAIDWNKVEGVWCNGASFDFPILKDLYDKCQLQTPWKYWAERDFRTLKNFFSKAQQQKLTVKPALAHDALEDARAQALTTMNMLASLQV